MPRRVEVVVRCKNEYPNVARTLDALSAMNYKVLLIDSGSTDGSLEVAKRAGVEILSISPESYVPGRVLNDAMRRTTGEVVAFVNADAVPLRDDAVERLVSRCRGGAAAAYGRQCPRQAASRLTVWDHERMFPAEAEAATKWRFRFFSMAASAVRRDVWDAIPFDEQLQYSEDVDWTSRLRALGFAVEYVPDAVFEHSHDYDERALERRMLGEGQADAVILRRGKPGYWQDLWRPLAGTLLRDARGRLSSRESVSLRWVAQRGRFKGLQVGAQQRARRPASSALPRLAVKYTLSGECRDEATVKGYLERTATLAEQELGQRMKGLLLLGSFGCGEGTMAGEGDAARVALSDIDLVVVTDSPGQARALRGPCAELSKLASGREGVAIDIWPAALKELSAPAGRLMWVDAGVRGARVISGSEELLGQLRGLTARSIPNEECARLLANRATGLALSRLALEQGAHDPTRALHHVAKSWLALGDALLIRVDRYDGSSAARAEQLARFAKAGAPRCRDLAERYRWALAQRAARTPPSCSASAFLEQLTQIWALQSQLEADRLAVSAFDGPLDYARRWGRIYRSLPDVPPLSRAFAGVRAAARHLVAWKSSPYHPREVLARASVVLAFEADRKQAFAWAKSQISSSLDGPARMERALTALCEVAA